MSTVLFHFELSSLRYVCLWRFRLSLFFLLTLLVWFRIREARALLVLESRARKSIRTPQIPRSSRSVSVQKIRKELGDRGLDVDMQDEVRLF